MVIDKYRVESIPKFGRTRTLKDEFSEMSLVFVILLHIFY